MSKVVVRLRGMIVNSSSSLRSGGSDGSGGKIGGLHRRSRQVGKKLPRHREGFFFRLGEIIDRAVTAMYLPSAERFFGDVVAHRVAHDWRACEEKLRNTADHHR
jgi:hypothetical protein